MMPSAPTVGFICYVFFEDMGCNARCIEGGRRDGEVPMREGAA